MVSIRAVIASELPECCVDCVEFYGCDAMGEWCNLTGETIDSEISDERRDWGCPFVEDERLMRVRVMLPVFVEERDVLYVIPVGKTEEYLEFRDRLENMHIDDESRNWLYAQFKAKFEKYQIGQMKELEILTDEEIS